MVVKVYISGISGNQEVKKRQQRVLMILDSKCVNYTLVDITEPGKESEKEFMQTNATQKGATIGDTNPRHPLPPQIFNDEEYCGDYNDFDNANELDLLEQFLKLTPADITEVSTANIKLEQPIKSAAEQLINGIAANGIITSREASVEKTSVEEIRSERVNEDAEGDHVTVEADSSKDEGVEDDASEEENADENVDVSNNLSPSEALIQSEVAAE